MITYTSSPLVFSPSYFTISKNSWGAYVILTVTYSEQLF